MEMAGNMRAKNRSGQSEEGLMNLEGRDACGICLQEDEDAWDEKGENECS